MHANALEEVVSLVLSYFVPLVEVCGAAVVMLGVMRTFAQYLHSRLRLDLTCLTSMRSELVRSLIMGLEFQLAADVLKTAISPTWNQILLLAALIGLRAALSYLMEREFHALCEGLGSTKGKTVELEREEERSG